MKLFNNISFLLVKLNRQNFCFNFSEIIITGNFLFGKAVANKNFSENILSLKLHYSKRQNLIVYQRFKNVIKKNMTQRFLQGNSKKNCLVLKQLNKTDFAFVFQKALYQRDTSKSYFLIRFLFFNWDNFLIRK